ncbi:MAG: chromate efflux transporter [Nitratireductor sp.]|nr:chromate efflux transporter [Nitratireductor sp.]
MTGYGELVRTFGKIGVLSFGGPAGQIALMHRVLVEEKGWLDERRFLHALNFCMLLPGPEAMQLATYSGWLLRGIPGGLIAGGLFVLPGTLILIALSAIYVHFGGVSHVEGALFGLKAAVLAIVVQALIRVAGRALSSRWHYLVALAALVALMVFSVPFPAVILGAAILGLLRPEIFAAPGEARDDWGQPVSLASSTVVFCTGLAIWFLPVLLLRPAFGPGTFFDLAVFFSKAAVVTFGGAYAVLAYVGQQAVEVHHWLMPQEMLAGLGLAETTPGPLILVLVFVGFVAAFRDAGGLDPMTGGLLGALITLWVTFVPCFIWIFLGAPFMERLRANPRLAGALAAITAAVTGVMANLAIWFGLHVLFGEVRQVSFAGGTVDFPVPGSADPAAFAIVLLAGLWLWRGGGVPGVLASAIVAGVAVRFLA